MGLYDAVPVPVMGKEGALKFLRDRFPEMAHLFADPTTPECDLDVEPYHSYGEFAYEVLRRQGDEQLMRSVYQFVDDLALSGQSILQELFVIEVLEVLATDATFAASLYPHIHREAQEALCEVEERWFGRSRP